MNVLLLSGAPKIGSQPIVDVARELGAEGITVRLAMWGAATPELLEAVPDAVIWGPVRVHTAPPPVHEIIGSTDGTDFTESTESEVDESTTKPPPTRPKGLGPERVKAALRWRLLRLRKAVRPYYGPARARVARQVRRLRRLRRAGVPHRTWHLLRADDAVMTWAREADVVVAMDSQSVLAAWKVARQLPDAAVVYGLSAGRGLVTRRLAG